MRQSPSLATLLRWALVAGALAVTVPTLAADGFEIGSPRLRVGISAAAWNLPKVNISQATGYAGDQVHFQARVVPMITGEAQLSSKLGFGAWYNPLDTDIYVEGPTADLLVAMKALPSRRVGKADLKMWNAHFNYQLPQGFFVQTGVTHYKGALNLYARDPRQPGDLRITARMESTDLNLWLCRKWQVWYDVPGTTYFTGGLGVRHRLSREGTAPGPKTAAEASAAFSYYPTDRFSIDVSAWLTDLTNRKTFTSRFNAGVSGHF